MAPHGGVLGRLLFPERAVCLACDTLRVDDGALGLCARCAEALVPLAPPACPRCGMPGWLDVCSDCLRRGPTPLEGVQCAYLYTHTARRLIRALKYGSVRAAAEPLAGGMAGCASAKGFHALVPVPLHPRRERSRGFNQADALAQAVSARMGLPVLNALERTRATRTQTRLSAQGRAENVSGAFACAADVRERALLLIDDVYTTGATALSCARALREAGASRVSLLAAARASEGLI